MKFAVVTLFPEYFEGVRKAGLLGKALEAGLVTVDLLDLRPFGEGKHKNTDDTPYGGGAGMVMKAGPVVEAVEVARKRFEGARVVLLCPQGKPFGQPTAERWAQDGSPLVFLCGRYEGFDERIRAYADEEASLGDFVLMGGEVAASAMMEATARLVPGVLGDFDSTVEESMSSGLLEYPHYTRPRVFRGVEVPEVLLNGDHARISQWRRRLALARTRAKRPDLLERADLSEAEREFLKALDEGADPETYVEPKKPRSRRKKPQGEASGQ